MLGALIRQAEQAGLMVEPGFGPKKIDFLIQISQGKYVGVIPLQSPSGGKSYAACPDLTPNQVKSLPKILNQKYGAQFLADNCDVVTLFIKRDKNGEPSDTNTLAKTLEKHATFVKLLELSSREVEFSKVILDFLQDTANLKLVQKELLRLNAKPTDKIAFEIDDVETLKSESWQDWWRIFWRNHFSSDDSSKTQNLAGTMLDFTDGRPTIPLERHPPLTKLGVGAGKTGATFISFYNASFTSYGLEKGRNSAISQQNATAYRAALDDLLSRAPVLGQMKVAAWFDHRQLEGQVLIDAIAEPAPLAPVMEDLGWDDYDDNAEIVIRQTPKQQKAVAQARARTLLTAIRKGAQPDEITAHYFALAISGASGRAMVRDWKTGSLESLAEAVTTWFDDLKIIAPNGKPAHRPKFFSLLLYMQRPKPTSTGLDDYLKPIRNLQLPLWRAALDPTMPIPFAALAKVIEAHKAHVMTGQFAEALSKGGSSEEKGRIYTRMALLRAYHVRKTRNQAAQHQGGIPMTAELDPNHPSPAYHCGRLMYLLANIQQLALGDVNAGVVQRYYGAASSTPAMVLGRLTRLSQHHLAKVAKSSGDQKWKVRRGQRLEEQLASVWQKLGPNLPKILNLEEQSLFALGYYQQLAAVAAEEKEDIAAAQAAKATKSSKASSSTDQQA